jgi:aqualysin 1
MKRLFAVVLGALAVSACQDVAGPEAPLAGPEGPPPRAVQADTIPGQYIVLLKSSVADVEAATRDLMWNRRSAIAQTYQYAVKGFAAKLSKAQADSLSRNPKVELVQPDLRVRGEGVTVQSNPSSWGIDRVDERDYPLDSRYSYGASGSGVNVYVIDGGVRVSHSEFGGRAHFAFDALGGSGTDCRGHGTHIAGTIAGATYGIAKKANIYSVKVLDCEGNSELSKIIAGVDWVTGHRKLPAVANMSLGSVGNSIFDAAVQASINSGVTYVASAGNDDTDACKQSPARVSQVLTVGATKQNDYRASWSNFGSCVDIFAPGDLITSAFYTSDGATRVMSGTSMASPHVAGVAALYLSAHPSATPSQVRSAIVGNATTGHVHDAAGTANRIVYSGFISGTSTSEPASSEPPPTEEQSLSSSSDPTASFTYSCDGRTCTFNSSASTAPNGLLSRTWRFGDGAEAGGEKVLKTYASSGTYTVRFYIYDVKGNYDMVSKSVTTGGSGGTSSSTSTSSASTSTTFSYKCATNRVCSFDARTLAANGASAFSWYFGDGTQAGSSYVEEKWYARSGSYPVKLTMLKDGKVVSVTKTVTVP